MVDPTTGVALRTLFSNVQALLKEMSGQSASGKGLLRWSLQKKLEARPSCSVMLIRVLVKELDKLLHVKKTPSYAHAIPLLHTLHCVVMQSRVMIPTSVQQTVHECLMSLLTFPSPYSAVALSTLRSLEMEMTTPGSLYQRRVTAERNLKHFTSQEKVLVLADPAVFSAPLEASLTALLGASGFLWNNLAVERNVLLHVLQRALGPSCQSSRLAQALEALGEQLVETYFQEVVLAVEESVKRGAGGRASYLNKLQHVYGDIITSLEAKGSARTEPDRGSVCVAAMPPPEINFLLWRDEEELWNQLAGLAVCSCSTSTAADEEEEKNTRDSVRSEDTNPSITRRNALKTIKAADKLVLMSEKMDASPGSAPVLHGDGRRHVARVVVLGDDRVLGRLARAYHSIRERESKHVILTNKLNLRFYYIPVTDVEASPSSPDSTGPKGERLSLASFLGRVDPWYNSNITSLGAAISKLAGTHSIPSQPPEQSLFLLDTLCYYLRCGTQPVHLPLYSVKVTRSSCDVVEDVFVSHLEVDILQEKSSKEAAARRKKPSVKVFGSVTYTKISLSKREVVKVEAPMTCGVLITSEPTAVTSGEDHLTVTFDRFNPGQNPTIRTQNISIRTLQHPTLSICLDKDSRTTYTDVQRVDISPCSDPAWFGFADEQELLLSKYLDKVLSLPVITFTGVTL